NSRVGVFDRALEAHRHAADLVHHGDQAAEADAHVVVDPQPGDVLDRLDQQVRPAERQRGVDLVPAVTGNVNVGVTRDADQHRPAAAHVQQHDGVRVQRARVEPDVQL